MRLMRLYLICAVVVISAVAICVVAICVVVIVLVVFLVSVAYHYCVCHCSICDRVSGYLSNCLVYFHRHHHHNRLLDRASRTGRHRRRVHRDHQIDRRHGPRLDR